MCGCKFVGKCVCVDIRCLSLLLYTLSPKLTSQLDWQVRERQASSSAPSRKS